VTRHNRTEQPRRKCSPGKSLNETALASIRDLIVATTGSEIVDFQSLKAAGGATGGVDPESSVYRALLTNGASVVVKAHVRRAAWVEEAENLRLLNALAPEHSVQMLASADHVIVMEDAGGVTLASRPGTNPDRRWSTGRHGRAPWPPSTPARCERVLRCGAHHTACSCR
jgi:hypothetical protein